MQEDPWGRRSHQDDDDDFMKSLNQALSFSPKWQGHPSEFFVVLMLVVLIISLIATNIFCLIILLILFFGLFKNIYYSLFTQHSAA